MDELKLCDIYQAKNRIHHLVRPTPFMAAPLLGERVLLKLECLQNTGAFKVRGAANKILSLSAKEQKQGVITFSTGNHGKAVAFVSQQSGVKSIVCLSKHVPAYRKQKIRSFGAEVVVHGDSQDEAEEYYNELIRKNRYIPVRPFDDLAVIAGQGTIALEMLAEYPDLTTILVPLSGGGLLAGIAFTAKQINPAIRVIGVSIERSPAMLESIEAGKPVLIKENETLADSLLGGIGMDNRYTLPMIKQYVDDHVVVSEPEIEQGMFYALQQHSLVIEGAAAVGIAALLTRKVQFEAGYKASQVRTAESIPAKSLSAESRTAKHMPAKSTSAMHMNSKIGIVVTGSTVDLPCYLEVMQKHCKQV